MQIVPGPDFPTGGMILGRSGIRSAYETARGSIVMRAKVDVEEVRKDRTALIVTEIPYQVNKSTMIEKIAELVRDKRIEGISDIRDESDRSGMRVVIELKRDAVPDVILNQLYRFSQLQTSFGANIVALNGGKPEQMNLSDMLRAFVSFREEVIQRRTRYLLKKARDRAHILVGLGIAVANIDEVIKLIRSAPDPATARAQLMERNWPAKDVESLILLIDDPRHMVQDDGTYKLSEEQARAILDLRLQRLTAMGRDEIEEELNKIGAEISDYLDILRSRARIQEIVRNEMLEIKEEFATPRRTEIIEGGANFDEEDLIQREDMVVTVSHGGYIKRVPLATYRAQRRGGKGRSGMATKDEDFVTRLFRRQYPHAGSVLLLARHLLQDEGVASSTRRTDLARKGIDQPATSRTGRTDHLDPAIAGRRGQLGKPGCYVRDHSWHHPPQQTVRFRQHQPQRQDCHEAGRR